MERERESSHRQQGTSSSRDHQPPWRSCDFMASSSIFAAWPPRCYPCSFCKREFRSAQALGGHMNVHRRDRARLRHGHGSPPPPPPLPAPAPAPAPAPSPPAIPNLNYPPPLPPTVPYHRPSSGGGGSMKKHHDDQHRPAVSLELGVGLVVCSGGSSAPPPPSPAGTGGPTTPEEDDIDAGLDLELRLGVIS